MVGHRIVANGPETPEFDDYVRDAASRGLLVVQPRMGMSRPASMAAGLREVSRAGPPTVGTITLDSYTRTGDHDAAREAIENDAELNGFPLVAHGPEVGARVAAAAGTTPVQVRHGSAVPFAIFETMVAAGLSASEGGPVSYCLPYGRTPLADSVARWRDASAWIAELSRANGRRAHLETFGGCLLGQLCPPSLLVATSLIEALFFAQQGVESVSLSYAQQVHPVQDVEALTALRILADEMLPAHVRRHLVLYAYMGVFPRTEDGARSLSDAGTDTALLGGAERLIVKTTAEAHCIPTVQENVAALRRAAARAERGRARTQAPGAAVVDAEPVLAEARALIEPVLAAGDIGQGLLAAFRAGLLDVPFCLHPDNRGLTRGAIDADGRLSWAQTGRLPLARTAAAAPPPRAGELLRMLHHAGEMHDRRAAGLDPADPPPPLPARDAGARP